MLKKIITVKQPTDYSLKIGLEHISNAEQEVRPVLCVDYRISVETNNRFLTTHSVCAGILWNLECFLSPGNTFSVQ